MEEIWRLEGLFLENTMYLEKSGRLEVVLRE